jgi:hypothetical protein
MRFFWHGISVCLLGIATTVALRPAVVAEVAAGQAASAQSINFFVAPDGNDSWSGKLSAPNAARSDGPFASVAGAQVAVQRLLINANPHRPIHIQLRAGTYYLALSPTNPGTLQFTVDDSGTADSPITWENYPGETPIISGGVALGKAGLGLTWTKGSGNRWQVRLPANTQAFEYLFYNGERRLRSRVQSASGTGYYMSNGACHATPGGQVVSIVNCNLGSFLRVADEVHPVGPDADCPSVERSNRRHAVEPDAKCIDRFEYDPRDTEITAWKNLNPPSGNPCHAGSNSYPVGDVELTLFDAWTVDVMRISCVDTQRHIIYFTAPTKGNGSEFNFFGPTPGHRYIIENAKDAFEQEAAAGQTGIWFLDRSASPWTLDYVANAGENPNSDTVVISQLAPADPTGGSLIAALNLSYVTFRGITFEIDNFIPAHSGFNDDENGECVLPEAIDCESCQHVNFDHIVVRHTSSSGILIASASSNSGSPATDDVIEDSAFYDIGDSGIRIGHHPIGYDRAAYVVQSVTVQNNLIQGYSRVFPDGEGIAQGNGNAINYSHNDVTDGYHAGISICLIACPGENGSNIITQYNHLWDLMQGITADGGALYYNVGGARKSGTGNRILNNLVHDVSDSSVIDQGVHGSAYGASGIYLDIQSAGFDIENNVVARVAQNAVHITGGPPPGFPGSTFKNNIFALARENMFEEMMPWPQGCNRSTSQVDMISNLFYFDRAEDPNFYVIDGCASSCGLPFNQFQNFQGNLYWSPDGRFADNPRAFHVLTNTPPNMAACTPPPRGKLRLWTFLTFSQWQNGTPEVDGRPLPMNEDRGGTVTVDPGFHNTGQPSDFMLSRSPVPGFDYTKTNDTIQHAGRVNPSITVPKVPDTFPTYSFSAADF